MHSGLCILNIITLMFKYAIATSVCYYFVVDALTPVLPFRQLQIQMNRNRFYVTSQDDNDLNRQGKQQQQNPLKSQRGTCASTSGTRLNMALVPLSVDDIEELLVVGSPSGLQYSTYWGRTKRETYKKLLGSAAIGFIGVFFSYFMSFVLGNFVATLLGTLFAFWVILSPDFKARQRNWEFLGGRPLVDQYMFDDDDDDEYIDDYYPSNNKNNSGLYGSIFLGKIEDVCVVENTASNEEYELDQFMDYDSETDEIEAITGSPYLIRIDINDDEDRRLQIHACLREEYMRMEIGMPVATVLLSTTESFEIISAMSDIYVPEIPCYVGDYPYLNRPGIESFFDDDELWDILQSQQQYSISKSDR